MEYDKEKVDDMTLALLYLVIHQKEEFGARVWKTFDWDTMNRLHEKGFISDPVNKSKSVIISPEGIKKAEELFKENFQK